MCGIMGYIGRKEAKPLLLDGLERLEYRGYDSSGVALLDACGFAVCKRAGRLSELKTAMLGEYSQRVGIGHTRWATHGAPTEQNAHPHLSEDGRFAVVHNGIIENYAALKTELQGEGVTFRSDTDTEVVAHLLSHHDTDDLYRVIADVVARLTGSYALAILCADRPCELFAVRRASPLVVGVAQDGCYLASDVTAVLPYTRRVMYPEEGDILCLTVDGVKAWDAAGVPVVRPVMTVAWDRTSADRGDYAHYMLKEIMEQPAALYAALSAYRNESGVRLSTLAGFPSCGWQAVKRIAIAACGSAYHAGLAGKYFIETVTGLPVEVDFASEFRYRRLLLDERVLTVVISQSGETADTLAALREAKRLGSPTLAVVNVPGSTIAREADRVLYTHAGPEVAVATTKGYTTQLALLYVLGCFLSAQRGVLPSAEYQRLERDLCALPELAERACKVAVEEAAKRLPSAQRVYFIGRGVAYAVALEAALKLKEISYIQAEGYAAGELKHGTISLIEQGTPVVVLADGDTLPEKTLSNLREVKARGAYTVAVVSEPLAAAFQEADAVITIPAAPRHLSAVPLAVVLQRLAYLVARERGCDIDKPRNLAKSVTVE